ncbi:MAG: nuclear transport factor 2 family protein [Thermoanaerobaculia bacterium]
MPYIRSAPVAIMVTAWLTAFGIPCHGAPPAMESQTQAGRETAVGEEFQAMMAKVDAAQLELQNGRPAAFKALWSHADDVTLSGGFGGAIEKGWEQISRRLDWVGSQYSKGAHTHDRIVANVNADLAYVVQIEHIRFHVPGQAKASTRDYRVTMVFRRESEGWRIVHRQADSQMMKQAPQ